MAILHLQAKAVLNKLIATTIIKQHDFPPISFEMTCKNYQPLSCVVYKAEIQFRCGKKLMKRKDRCRINLLLFSQLFLTVPLLVVFLRYPNGRESHTFRARCTTLITNNRADNSVAVYPTLIAPLLFNSDLTFSTSLPMKLSGGRCFDAKLRLCRGNATRTFLRN